MRSGLKRSNEQNAVRRNTHSLVFSGFTLVELSVALALAGMLMAAIVGVLVQIKRQVAITHAITQTQWHDEVNKLVRRDFLGATSVCVRSGDIWLKGEFCTTSSKGDRTQWIGYGIRPWIVNGQQVLVRYSPGKAEPLVVGPTKILLERLDQVGAHQPVSDQFTPSSPSYIMWIWIDNQVQPALTIHLTSR